jgi:hypothetical protein
MSVKHWLLVAALGLLSSSWAQADSIPPNDGHYTIELDDFDYPQTFSVTPDPELPPPSSILPCIPDTGFCFDAAVRVNAGGGSEPEDGPYSFTDNAPNCMSTGLPGDYICDFQNTGPTFTALEISTELNNDEVNDPFVCNGGTIFASCGFTETDPPNSPSGIQLNVFFYNAYNGGVPTVVPEPAQWGILLLACAAVIVARKRQKAY